MHIVQPTTRCALFCRQILCKDPEINVMSLPHDLSDLCQCVCAQSEDKSAANWEIFYVKQPHSQRDLPRGVTPCCRSPCDDFDLRLMWTLAAVFEQSVCTQRRYQWCSWDQTKASVCTVGENHWRTCHRSGARSISSVECSKFSLQCLFDGQLWLLLCAVTGNEQSLSLVCYFCVACSATHCLLSSRVLHCLVQAAG